MMIKLAYLGKKAHLLSPGRSVLWNDGRSDYDWLLQHDLTRKSLLNRVHKKN